MSRYQHKHIASIKRVSELEESAGVLVPQVIGETHHFDTAKQTRRIVACPVLSFYCCFIADNSTLGHKSYSIPVI